MSLLALNNIPTDAIHYGGLLHQGEDAKASERSN
jgi:hypothetical protein